MDQFGPKMDQHGLKIVCLYQIIPFLVVAEDILSEKIFLNEVSQGEAHN